MIRVVYAEDQTIVRRGIIALLETTADIRVIGEAIDGEQALEMVRALRPDVALLDIRMPKRSGIEVLNKLNESGWAPYTIFLTTFDEDPLFLQAVQAGALGFFLKDVTLERLADAIRRVASGKATLQPAMTERVVQAVQARGNRFESLPEPERFDASRTGCLAADRRGLQQPRSCRCIVDERGLSQEPHFQCVVQTGSSGQNSRRSPWH